MSDRRLPDAARNDDGRIRRRTELVMSADFDALVDPFAAGTINRTLVGRGWVCGAGAGRFGKPQFFLAELEREE
jgi:hypothetical protein